jgi:predicted AlkP superfamily phosphohydrolase/phosphomutase
MTLNARTSLVSVALASVCAAACSAPEPEPLDSRVLVIGWDGATFDLLDPLVEAGRLPNLARLMESGATAELASTIVPISSAAWVGAVTGVTPGDTGVYDFFEPIPKTYNVRLTSSQSNHRPPLWRILEWHERRSIVFGVPLTWPPEEIEDGVIVAGMLSPFEAEYAHPPGLADELRARGFVPDLGIWREHRQLTPQLMNEQLELKRDIVVEMLSERDWDFAMVVFKSLDVLGHRTYDGALQGPVAQWCDRLDDVLGDLLDAAGEHTDVIVLSDHGFAPYSRQFFTHAWLIEQGFAVERSGGAARGGQGGPLATARREEHELSLGSLDLARTRAFAGAAEGNYGGVRLNLRGREPDGIVEQAEFDVLLSEIAARLRAARIPGTDRPLVTDVVRATDLYPGKFVDRLPDLLFETDPSIAVRPVTRERSFVEMRAGNVFPDHARAGIWIAAGPSFAARTERTEVDIFDLAPTVLHALGLPVHFEMQGVARAEMFAERRAVEEVPRSRVAAGRAPRWREVEGEAADDVMKRLRELGYTEGIDDEQSDEPEDE